VIELPATLTASLMTDEKFVKFYARYPDYSINRKRRANEALKRVGTAA
jgi:hypothetical protein